MRRFVSLRLLYVLLVTYLILVSIQTGLDIMPFRQKSEQNEIVQPFLKIASIHSNPVTSNNDEIASCLAGVALPHCYSPDQIRHIYGISPLLAHGITGKGSTIVIIDAFQAPMIQDDLSFFDKTFGLSDPTLNIIAPDGLTSFDPTNYRQVIWSAEISLDVEWAHVIAPDATIDLVLAKSSKTADLLSTINYAVDHNLGDAISMSFGQNEACLKEDPLDWHKTFTRATLKGISLFAASGDDGAAMLSCDGLNYVKAVSTPANDPLVTSVGGTQLRTDSQGNYQSEVAWNEPDSHIGTGGGFSTIFKRPFYQTNITNIPANMRGLPDVAYNAALNGGILTAWSESPEGPHKFFVFGGTSAGSPQWAGLIALGVQLGHHRLGFINPAVYFIGHSFALHDVTVGNNTIRIANPGGGTATVTGFDAGPGWDATTGWGTPQASVLVPLLSLVSQEHDFTRSLLKQ